MCLKLALFYNFQIFVLLFFLDFFKKVEKKVSKNTKKFYKMSYETQGKINEIVEAMKQEANKSHMESLKGQIAEACFLKCTQTHNLKEECVKKCTQLYISTWNTMSGAVIPELKKANGI